MKLVNLWHRLFGSQGVNVERRHPPALVAPVFRPAFQAPKLLN